MPDRLNGICAKIARAKQHIREFQAEWMAFGKRAYEIWAKEEGDRRVFRVEVKEEIPAILSTIIGDATNNLRCALDYIIYQLLESKGIKVGRNHYFPISDSAEKFKKTYRARTKGIGTEAERIIGELKPYKDGTDAFWYLNELCRTDKHRLLVTVAIVPETLALNLGDMFASMPLPDTMAAQKDKMAAELESQFLLIRGDTSGCSGLKDGDIVFSQPLEMKPYENTRFGFRIVFAEQEVLRCRPVSPLLSEFVSLTKRTVDAFRPLLT